MTSLVHQMKDKTAYLHAPIDHEILMDQPEVFVEMLENGGRMVYKLKKSLYGLKHFQAGTGISFYI